MVKTSAPATNPEQMAGRTDFSIYDISWYKPGPRWKLILWFLANSLVLNTYFPIPMALKRFVLKAFGTKMGVGVVIKPGVNIKYPWFLTLGDHVWIGERVWIDNLSEVVIGSHVCLSQGAMLLTGNHDYRRPTFDLTARPITLDDGVWIGAKSVVCPGVRCHSHSVLAVNSVATRSLDEYGIYQGNPAVWVRKREIFA
ncbi:colanic acid biosynthesis acetyltransferase WcaF [Spirosoma taeanense]|uniref:Colanic acid biosynthesis acetyltransferase WcaF n=1 Tax=Spirosoma taeanense TaxID=2735870 RepID=A0A6M5YB24_9BACT|nr:WcaF family extracellular polysaccharide biosynthesis acetyltransferase [Spirosoma taeanense]QJW90744.1 colanic acid biosynthesis acetyltransferase WcaF [Spirosoma taeanense]